MTELLHPCHAGDSESKATAKPEEEISIDVLDSFVRIGSVYLTKPVDQGGASGGANKPLVHLPRYGLLPSSDILAVFTHHSHKTT
jgi:hypothetical protein